MLPERQAQPPERQRRQHMSPSNFALQNQPFWQEKTQSWGFGGSAPKIRCHFPYERWSVAERSPQRWTGAIKETIHPTAPTSGVMIFAEQSSLLPARLAPQNNPNPNWWHRRSCSPGSALALGLPTNDALRCPTVPTLRTDFAMPATDGFL
jgi:hypothetical protein